MHMSPYLFVDKRTNVPRFPNFCVPIQIILLLIKVVDHGMYGMTMEGIKYCDNVVLHECLCIYSTCGYILLDGDCCVLFSSTVWVMVRVRFSV